MSNHEKWSWLRKGDNVQYRVLFEGSYPGLVLFSMCCFVFSHLAQGIFINSASGATHDAFMKADTTNHDKQSCMTCCISLSTVLVPRLPASPVFPAFLVVLDIVLQAVSSLLVTLLLSPPPPPMTGRGVFFCWNQAHRPTLSVVLHVYGVGWGARCSRRGAYKACMCVGSGRRLVAYVVRYCGRIPVSTLKDEIWVRERRRQSVEHVTLHHSS